MMNYPGRGFGTPRGLQRPHATSFTHAQAFHLSHEAGGHARNELGGSFIPGLGLGAAPAGPAQAPRPAVVPPLTQAALSSSHPAMATGQPGSDRNSGTDGGSEEGEISDDEAEDLYEPPGAIRGEHDADMSGWPSDGAGVVASLVTADQQQHGAAATLFQKSNTSRDRSGSYSPRLSPREIDRAGSSPSSTRLDSSAHPSSSSSTAPKSLATAKKQAQEAILRLWPLNIRYNNYIEAGIESTFLGVLFKELGLDTQTSSVAPCQAPKAGDDSRAKTAPAGKDPKAGPPTAKSPSAPPAKPSDKSEERKDRIARLLAAKGSKASAPTATATATASTTASAIASATAAATAAATAPATAPAAVPAAGEQAASLKTEKSKLLQLKMEALRKKRERDALAQSRDRQATSPGTPLAAKDPEQAASGSAAGVMPKAEDRPDTSAQSEVVGRSEKISPSSIPGLFLSSSLHSSYVQDPASSTGASTPSVTGMLSEEPRRPFSQNIESRPFLIHVSDEDDDDAEMDMESPDVVASPASHVEPPSHPPGGKQGSLLGPARGAQSTPARHSGHSSGGEDLDSMNKKIEAMKRRIAEAEARKAKRSRPGSPVTSHRNDTSHDDSTDATSIPKARAESADEDRTSTSRSPADTAPARVPAAQATRLEATGFHASAPERRGRSRAASERLTLIAARRREQLLRLRALQSQIEKVERDIAESMAEEDRLRQDIAMPDSDQEPSQPVAIVAPIPRQSHLIPAGDSRSTGAKFLYPIAETDDVLVKEMPEQASENQAIDYAASASRVKSSEPSATSGSNSPDVTSEQPSIECGSSVASRAGESVDEGGTVGNGGTQAARPEATAGLAEAVEQDVDMADASESPDDLAEDGSDGYEPPDAGISTHDETLSNHETPAAAHQAHESPADSGSDGADTPLTGEQMSVDQPTYVPEKDDVDSVPLTDDVAGHLTLQQAVPAHTGHSSFVAYQTPLQYFHSYRFHPNFNQSVAGGLRSMTYSNKIDAQKEVCPDQLAGQACPRGGQCQYQHFESMRAADDQILLELGATGHFDDGQKQQYISGLRQLLTDFRDRKVKDFDTISRGIIEYRARFQGDKSKILPLGNVSV